MNDVLPLQMGPATNRVALMCILASIYGNKDDATPYGNIFCGVSPAVFPIARLRPRRLWRQRPPRLFLPTLRALRLNLTLRRLAIMSQLYLCNSQLHVYIVGPSTVPIRPSAYMITRVASLLTSIY